MTGLGTRLVWLVDVWAQSVAPARTGKGAAREAHTPRRVKCPSLCRPSFLRARLKFIC
ncbi:hypothetical protein PR003_g13004 [Phytophthora rubi]|uniref:RxLR effector protein n=1 Tax=Phytophthora rubi TaxID=129364 RepID=A0A6A4F6Z6_9STRA|nr:hypothetical protein PR001_g22471 [Phytophthora rubi]KAE8993549.1 hypothetical protein PR002_g20206 [Phytophthora rubi]KAE9335471.1 hypothetical protein PR003_g13004 [Phytophthora rubi]